MQGMTWERQNALHRVFDAAVRQRTCSETGGWRVCLPAGCGVPRRCGEKISDRPLGDAECSGDDGFFGDWAARKDVLGNRLSGVARQRLSLPGNTTCVIHLATPHLRSG
jgi:hypothetical protein